MNKYIIYIVILLVLGSGVWLISQKNKKDGGNIPQSAEANVDNAMLSDGQYAVSEGSKVHWEGKKPLILGYKDDGVISIKSGSFTVENGEIKSGEIILDMNSISVEKTGKENGAGGSMLENHLKSDDFFSVENYPEAKFVISSVGSTEAGIYDVRGDLTLKGITKPVAFTAYAYNNNGQDMLKSDFTIDRTDWDIRYASNKFFSDLADSVIDDNIYISFDIPVSKQ